MSQSSIFWVVTTASIIVVICQLLIVYNQFQNTPPQISDVPIISSSKGDVAPIPSSPNDPLPDNYPYGLVIPKTAAVALPSVRISAEEDAKVKRSIYGGAGDKPHLGGFTSFDPMGVSPTLW